MSEHAEQFGRVAQDGTVYVTLPDGSEVVVGQWATGDPAEGLAFYRRRFDDLVAEVRLMADRLKQGTAKPDQADDLVNRLRGVLATPQFVGDIAGLSSLLDALHKAAADRRLQLSAETARVRSEALAQREQIVVTAESLATSSSWKATGDKFKALLEEWKAAPKVDRAAEQALWERFRAARIAFDRARRAHFAQLDSERAEAKAIKEKIVAEAEGLSSSVDWGPTSRAYRDLMNRWKASPRASREDEQKLWARFKAAQDAFFGARNDQFAQRDAGQEENLTKKKALVEEAEALLPIRSPAKAKDSLRSIAQRWEAIGHVPRAAQQGIESRLRKVEDAVARAERAEWKRTDPAAADRAKSTVALFSAQVDKQEAELQAAEAAGNTAKARKIASSLESTKALLAAAQDALAEFSG